MFVRPKEVVEKYFELRPGMVVADFGAGSGHYTLACAEIVGDSGIVYAIDILRDLLDKIKKEAQERGLNNVEIIWADLDKPEGSRLSSQSVDFVIISNLLFQVESKDQVIKEAFRVLKNGGRVAVIDWSDSFGGLGPRKEDVVEKQECERMFLENGFVVEKEFDPGLHHYGFIFKKP